MLNINYITTDSVTSGRTVHEQEIRKRLKGVNLNIIKYFPSKVNIRAVRVVKKLLLLPLRIILKKKNLLTHITSEDLAFLLNFIKFKKVIVTCHDLIPLVYEKNSSLFLKLNMRGLKKADRIITVSNFSKNDIVKYLNYSADKIDVINNAVDRSQYYPRRSKEILKKYDISGKVILYVGSEQPRQNLEFLIKGFYQLKKILPDVKLVKIGRPQTKNDISKLVKELNLENDIIFLGFVEDLSQWYNAVDLFVYPCLYAGFGIPPLEAMACGTPVITSNTTALPEVIGNAGIMINPDNQDQLIKSMYQVLTNETLSNNLSQKGIARSKLFTWERAAQQTIGVYKNLSLNSL